MKAAGFFVVLGALCLLVVVGLVAYGVLTGSHRDKQLCDFAYRQQIDRRKEAISGYLRVPPASRGTLVLPGLPIVFHPRRELRNDLHNKLGNKRLPPYCPQHDLRETEKVPPITQQPRRPGAAVPRTEQGRASQGPTARKPSDRRIRAGINPPRHRTVPVAPDPGAPAPSAPTTPGQQSPQTVPPVTAPGPPSETGMTGPTICLGDPPLPRVCISR